MKPLHSFKACAFFSDLNGCTKPPWHIVQNTHMRPFLVIVAQYNLKWGKTGIYGVGFDTSQNTLVISMLVWVNTKHRVMIRS